MNFLLTFPLNWNEIFILVAGAMLGYFLGEIADRKTYHRIPKSNKRDKELSEKFRLLKEEFKD